MGGCVFCCFYMLHSFSSFAFSRNLFSKYFGAYFGAVINICAKRRGETESESGQDGEEAAQEIAEPEEPNDK